MNKTSHYDLSVIIPVYNEEDNLDRVEKAMAAFVGKAVVKTCVVFANDGSTDGSLARIKDICHRHTDFFISSDANHGLSTAMKADIDAIGFLAQEFFSARMLILWILSERAHRVMSTNAYWTCSLAGSILLFV